MPLPSQWPFKLPPILLALLSLVGFCILVRVHSFSLSHPLPNSVSTTMKATRSSSPPGAITFEWKTLDPSSFPSPVSEKDGFRYAKDDEYLAAVLGSWEQDIATQESSQPQEVETSPWIYHDEQGTPLYGHIVRPIASSDFSVNASTKLPGILLFHTAAGPQDVFLFEKAAQLASSDLGCVVFICDVLSDQDGWAWTPNGDRTKFNTLKEELLQENASLMRSRVKAAVRSLVDSTELGVDPKRLASLGWCFGAQPILELANLQYQQDVKTVGKESDALAFSVTALISYHGVYRRDSSDVQDLSTTGIESQNDNSEREVLICTGKIDPFVAPEDLDFARATMQKQKFAVRIMEFDGAKHGFTNPAQDFNSNPAFQYNEAAATQSWEASMALLRRKLLN